MNTPRLPPKKDVAIALLQKSSVYVHLDPRHEGVRVPPWLKQRVPLVLQVGLNMPVRIPDLEVGDESLSCTLSFQRRPYLCFVPWAAVYALVGEDQRGMVWPDDVPPEVAAQAQKQQQVEKRRASMRQVSGGDAPHGAPDEPQAAAAGPSEPEAARVGVPSRASVPSADGKRPVQLGIAAQPEPRASLEEVEAGQVAPTSPTPDHSAKSEATKKGRSLPPYLRVVK